MKVTFWKDMGGWCWMFHFAGKTYQGWTLGKRKNAQDAAAQRIGELAKGSV